MKKEEKQMKETMMETTAGSRTDRFRIWDLTLLWCFAFVLWSFLPAPVSTDSEVSDKTHEVQLEREQGLALATINHRQAE